MRDLGQSSIAPERATPPARVVFGGADMEPAASRLVWRRRLRDGLEAVVSWLPPGPGSPDGHWVGTVGSRSATLGLVGPRCDTAQGCATLLDVTLRKVTGAMAPPLAPSAPPAGRAVSAGAVR